tara:strand:- start:23 stop:208 length:186 start_codon:yes stop_codon:yes gene_type:complete
VDIDLQCALCENLKKDLKCKAFPMGIPEKIIVGEHDHTKPFKGDGGIRFEPIKELNNNRRQ